MEVVKDDAAIPPKTYKHKHVLTIGWERTKDGATGQTVKEHVSESLTIAHEHEPMENNHWHTASVENPS